MNIRTTLRLGAVACAVGATALTVLIAPAANADSVQHISGTGGEGLWLHTEPGLSTGLITVIGEGEEITASCYMYSDTVSSPISEANPIWLLVSTSAGQGWVSDAYVDTFWSSTADLDAAGIGACDSGPMESAEGQAPESSAEALAVPDAVISYEGDAIGYSDGVYPLAYALWDHYLWGNGDAAVADSQYFANTPGFYDAIMSLPVGGFSTWSADRTSDLFLSVGTFTISRETDNCWAAYDRYDFDPDKPENVAYLPFWSYQVSGARSFDVHASGCF